MFAAATAAWLVASAALADVSFTSRPATTATVGDAYAYTMTAAEKGGGRDADKRDGELRFTAPVLPSWLSFDGNNTISGTPKASDIGVHRVRLRVRRGKESDEQSFFITVAPSLDRPPPPPPPGAADLEASVTVAPNPVLVGETATWTAVARNSSDVDVANVVLETVLSGDASYSIDTVDDKACAAEPRADGAAVTCRWPALPSGASKSVEIEGRASAAGEIVAVTSVAIVDPAPVDGNASNDEARAALTVTEAPTGGPEQTLAAPGVVAVAAADFDGDGRDDLAAASASGQPLLIFLGGGDESQPFTAEPLAVGEAIDAAAIAAADLDADGDADLVVGSPIGPHEVLLNDGSGGFEAATPLEDSGGPNRAVAVADVDGDSLPDVVLANEGTSTVHRNLGSGEFGAAEPIAPGPHLAVAAADLAGDGRARIVLVADGGDAAVYAREAGSYSRTADLATESATSAAAADVDGDGMRDLAFGRSAGGDLVWVAAPGASPPFSPTETLEGTATAAVLLADFDVDGRIDLASIRGDGAHALYRNQGTPGDLFATSPDTFAGGSAKSAASGRFDANDLPDVAVVGTDVIEVFVNIGRPRAGGAAGAPRLSLNGNPNVVVVVGDKYEDPGATAFDDLDGDLTDAIVVDNPVDTEVIGTYTITYEVVDSSGNKSTATRTVEVHARDASGGGGGGSTDAGLLALLAFGLLGRAVGPAIRSARGRRP